MLIACAVCGLASTGLIGHQGCGHAFCTGAHLLLMLGAARRAHARAHFVECDKCAGGVC